MNIRGRLALAALAVAVAACTGPATGTWTAAGPPVDRAAGPAEFQDVSCAEATACVAVGRTQDDRRDLIASRWDGTTWTSLPPVPVANTVGPGKLLLDDPRIDCAGPAACVLVTGVSVDGQASRLLSAIWDGTRWTAEASPPTPGYTQWLDVACGGPRACLAVGYKRDDVQERVARAWDGTTWAPVAAPPTETGIYGWQFQSRLACATPTSCAFLTGASFPDGRTRTSVHVWDGRRWTTTPAPLAVAGLGLLQDIDCSSPTSCRAVGWVFGSGAVTVRWDGTRWTRESTAFLAQAPSAVSCAGERCLAVAGASAGTGMSPAATIAGLVRAGGAGWSLTTSIAPGADLVARAVSCAGDRCLVVGQGYAEGRGDPVALSYRF